MPRRQIGTSKPDAQPWIVWGFAESFAQQSLRTGRVVSGQPRFGLRQQLFSSLLLSARGDQQREASERPNA